MVKTILSRLLEKLVQLTLVTNPKIDVYSWPNYEDNRWVWVVNVMYMLHSICINAVSWRIWYRVLMGVIVWNHYCLDRYDTQSIIAVSLKSVMWQRIYMYKPRHAHVGGIGIARGIVVGKGAKIYDVLQKTTCLSQKNHT